MNNILHTTFVKVETYHTVSVTGKDEIAEIKVYGC
jgi:hypothetical protein